MCHNTNVASIRLIFKEYSVKNYFKWILIRVNLEMNEEQIKKTISLNMISIMRKDSLTESGISEATGISQAAINRIKNGNVCASIYQIYLIAEALKVEIDDLIGKKDDNTGDGEKKYLPVFSSADAMNDKSEIKGFAENQDLNQNTDMFGLRVDKSFASNLLTQGSVVIIQKQFSLKPGDTVLFISDSAYQIGIFRDNCITSMDNLFSKTPLDQINLIGQVVKIQKEYVKSKSLVEKLVEAAGEKELIRIFKTITN